jgi:hypothetical protein
MQRRHDLLHAKHEEVEAYKKYPSGQACEQDLLEAL